MRLTPHVAVAGTLLLVSLVVAAGGILVDSGEAPIPSRELTVPVDALPAEVVPASAANKPLLPAYATGIDQNPFEEPQATSSRTGITANLRLPAPPPPPVDLPELPALPLAQP